MAKSKSDIPLGGAEQNMSREELAAVAKTVAALSQEDRDLLAAVQESPFRLTTAEQFLEFEKNVDCFVLEPHVQTLEDLGWEYLEEKLTIDLTDDLRAAIDPAPFGRHALEEDRGCFTSRGYLFPTDDPWQHDRPQAKQADRKPSIKERLEQSNRSAGTKIRLRRPTRGNLSRNCKEVRICPIMNMTRTIPLPPSSPTWASTTRATWWANG